MFAEYYTKRIYVREQAQVDEAVREILSFDLVGFDLETTGLHVLLGARMSLAQFALPNGKVYVFDILRVGRCFLYDIFPFPGLVVGHNLKFDFGFLTYECGIKSFGKCFDTLQASQLVSEGDIGSSTRFNLKAICARHLDGFDLPKDEQASDWGRRELSENQLHYAALDAWVLLRLYDVLLALLYEQAQLRVAGVEFDAVPGVTEMELNGFELHQGRWEEQYRIAEVKLEQTKGVLWDYFEGYSAPGKPKYGKGLQEVPMLFSGARVMPLTTVKIKEGFAKKGITLPLDDNTGNFTLRDFKVEGAIRRGEYDEEDAEALRAVLRYAKIRKQLESYGLEWFNFINPHTGRIHQSYKQIGADTGRFSCFDPNLQNIPTDEAYRNCFIAGEGWVLIAADYSQQELRLLAEYCRDKNLLAAFDSGLDLHRFTASLIYQTAFDLVTGKQRSIAKNMNFLIVYGGGIMKLSESTGMTLDESRVIMDLYLKQTYPALASWLDSRARFSVREMFSETMTGRKRRFWGDMQDDKVRSRVERMGKNHPIQGTSADMSKRALYFAHETFKHDKNVESCHIVHDELIVRARPWAAYEATDKLKKAMLKAEEEYLWRVPSKVDVTITLEWSKDPQPEQLEAAKLYIERNKN